MLSQFERFHLQKATLDEDVGKMCLKETHLASVCLLNNTSHAHCGIFTVFTVSHMVGHLLWSDIVVKLYLFL